MNTVEVTPSGEMTTSTDTPDSSDMIMFVQLRPTFAAKDRCLAALERLARKHQGVDVTIAGLSKDSRYLRITLAINLGPVDQIAKFSPESQSGYAFVAALFSDMFDFLPQYTPGVTAEERTAAEALNTRRSTRTHDNVAVLAIDPRHVADTRTRAASAV